MDKEENKVCCDLEDGRTELEIYQEKKIIELNKKIEKLEIENNLMKSLLANNNNYIYGIR